MMIKPIRFMLLLGVVSFLPMHLVVAQQNQADQIWTKIQQTFEVPQEFQNDYGTFKSPLVFDNGERVQSSSDWEERREEILERWHGMMGEWPDLLTEQELEILESEKREDFTQYKVRFNWLPNEVTEGYLLVPDGAGKKPAVITVFYEPESAVGLSEKPHRDYAYQLAKRGFVTLSIGTTETTNNRTYSLYYPNRENAQIQPISTLAYAAANAWHVLSKVDEVDPDRIGIVGHSYGGKWAMFASALYDKFACAAWSDPGIVFDETRRSVNYWEPWYLGYYPPPWENTWRGKGLVEGAKGLYPKLLEQEIDLTEIHALMAPRPFLVSGGSEDPPHRWKALNHTIAINDLLGYKNRVGMTNRPKHSPNEESNEQVYLFFEYYLKHQKAKEQ